MTNKLKITGADRITTARRDAVLAAAVHLVETSAPTPQSQKLFDAVSDYQCFKESLGPESEGCMLHICPSPQVCKRHGHCFAKDDEATK